MDDRLGSDWKKSFDAVKAAFDRRFPDVKCLRCGGGAFGLRLSGDASLAATSARIGADVAELICTSCGFVERHHVAYLLQEVADRHG